ncbi:hypothetical protein C6558_36155 [Ensifer sp. NM-2]|uniref:hypothetical protein n=1 Tax=Ensifer sp. NM-2 TaxID=2109730 RepID=UPI000D1275C1|nr:hypothetical protein [Ensifer sp. NM-2]PSS59859.1 hypothetical protein C6558_36155 [Ensifer sp. NM-2]
MMVANHRPSAGNLRARMILLLLVFIPLAFYAQGLPRAGLVLLIVAIMLQAFIGPPDPVTQSIANALDVVADPIRALLDRG